MTFLEFVLFYGGYEVRGIMESFEEAKGPFVMFDTLSDFIFLSGHQ